MKKCLALLLASLMLLSVASFGVSAADSEHIRLQLNFSGETNALIVSGHVLSEKDGIPMTLYVSGSDGVTVTPVAADKALALGYVTLTDGTEGIPFSFAPVKLPNNADSTTLTVTVTAAWINETATATHDYAGVVDQLEVLKNLNAYISAGSEEDYAIEVVSNAGILGVKAEAFSNLTYPADDIALANLMSRTYVLPEIDEGDEFTKEDSDAVKQAVKEFSQQYQEATQLGAFFNLTSLQALNDWYEANKEAYGLLLDDPDTDVDEADMVPYFEDVLKSKGYIDRIPNMVNVKSMSELSVEMKHQALLQTVEDGDRYKIQSIIISFETLLTELDYTTWANLSANEKILTCADLGGDNYATIDAFTNAVNRALKNPTDTEDYNDSNRESSGSGGGSKTVRISNSALEPEQKPVVGDDKILPFSDLNTVPWAHEAIAYLYNKGIVSGRDAQNFDPDAPVTRAELIKMLVEGLGIGTGFASTNFTDVEQSAWYAGYVSAAEEKGLIKGDENGNFYPNSPISRQDAAVILYRALSSAAIADSADFIDSDSIADYAKAAVDYMYSAGVINGVGDRAFAPLAKLSRAQLAKMLYLMFQL